MNRLIESWESTFYTDVILYVVLFATLFVSISRRKYFPQLRLFPLYLVFFILLTTSSYIRTSLETTPYISIMPFRVIISQEYFVALLEYFVFSIFIMKILYTSHFKRIVQASIAVTTIAFTLGYIFTFNVSSHAKYVMLHYLYLVESALLLLGVVFYYIELFKFSPQSNLLKNPQFWVTSGLTFYLLCTLPITIISPHLLGVDRGLYINMFSMIYTFYIILFLMIIKGYLCRRTDLI